MNTSGNSASDSVTGPQKFGLPEETYQKICQYFQMKSEVTKVVIYGSRALGTMERGSDIDLAIFFEPDLKKSLWRTSGIKADLEDLPTPYTFDVTDYELISYLPLKEHIDQFGVIFFNR